MLLLKKKFEYFRAFLQILFLICCLFFLSSCGEDTCYQDIDIANNGSISIGDTKTIEVTTQNEEKAADSVSIENGGYANIEVSGTAYMCKSSQQNITYATTCKNGTKTICKYLCFTDSESYCASYYASSCIISHQITDDASCGAEEDSVCISGTKWTLFGEYATDASGNQWVLLTAGNGIYAQDKNQKQYDLYSDNNQKYVNVNGKKTILYPSGNNKYTKSEDPCSEPIICSNGTKKYIVINSDGTTKSDVIEACSTSQDNNSYTIGISALNDQWTEIGSDIYKGDILSFSINSPADGSPSVLSKNSKYSYSNSDNTTINRWSDSTIYSNYCSKTKCDKKCPNSLSFDESLSSYSDCAATKQLIADGYKMQSYDSQKGLWNTFGKGLVLTGVENGDCPVDDTQCDGTYFNSTSNSDTYSNFGVLTNLGIDGTEVTDSQTDLMSSIRKFIPKQNFSKLCAKICDTDYTDNLGGYNLNIERKSCVAVNGAQSPCCSDGRGALQYKWGEDGEWSDVFTGTEYLEDGNSSSSSSSKITNNTDDNSLYFRIKSDSTIRPFTSGSYSVKITYSSTPGKFTPSSIIEDIKNITKNFIYGSSEKTSIIKQYFSTLSGDIAYRQYLRMLLMLFIVLYGLAFLAGYVEISQKDLLIRILKIGVVVTLTTDQSYSFFHDYFFDLFINGSDELIKKSNFIDSNPGPNVFSFIDSTFILLFFNKATWLKIPAMLISSPFGIIIVILLLISILWFILGVFTALVVYLTCFLGIAILIFLAPIFIPFILFKPTNHLFKNWCKLLFRFAIEPVMLVIGLQLLVALFYTVFVKIIDFTVCWKCAIPINLASISSIKAFLDTTNITTEVFCLAFFGMHGIYGLSGGAALFAGTGISIANIILLLVLSYLIKDYSEFITGMLNNFVDSSSVMPGQASRTPGGTGGVIRSKLGINALQKRVGKKFEKSIGKKLRTTIQKHTGFKLRTKEEYESDKRRENEEAKRKGLRLVDIDLDKNKFNEIIDNISAENYAKELHRNDGTINDKVASRLGNEMFEELSNDKIAYKSFADGMSRLQNATSKELDNLEKEAPGIKDMHKLLNSSELQKSVANLSSENITSRTDAMKKLGDTMFADKAVSKMLLDKTKRENFSKKLFKLAHTPRPKIS